MTDGKRPRRRRGRRGGRPQQDARPPDATEPQPTQSDERPARRDNRRSVRGDAPATQPPGPSSNIRRAPAPDRDASRRPRGDDRARRGADDRRPREDRGGRPRRDDGAARIFEPPVPQDPVSIELGAAFREAQIAMRDARKALDKRRAEYADEPEWLVEQLTAAAVRFTAAADAWTAHLETTGRKVVRNR